MSGTRPVKKGSFGGHLDDLVKHFEHEPPGKSQRSGRDGRDLKDGHDVHDRLFESAWRKARETHRSA